MGQKTRVYGIASYKAFDGLASADHENKVFIPC